MRTILVGDVHGCAAELERLLDHVGFVRSDRLVLVGDLVARGPDPRAVLDLVREARGQAVRGNHEHKLLRWKSAKARNEDLPLGPTHRATVKELREKDFAFFAEMPLWIDLPEHGVRVVHAGVVPGIPIDRQLPKTLLFVRNLGPNGEPIVQRDGGVVPWGARYEGPPHIVFGHNALDEPQLHPFATGIDTGCVYGGRLTAMVLRAGEHVPAAHERRDVLVTVPAKRAYFPR